MISRWRVLFLAAWCTLTVGGIGTLERYAHTPGADAAPPPTWPADAFARTPGRATIVMLAHPRCPCTRASVRELAKVMAHLDHRAEAWVVFYTPAGAGSDWTTGGLWDIARGIPGVHVVADGEGRFAARMHARTSGQVLAYDVRGRLVFDGGITAARGHEGDSTGESRLLAAIDGSSRGGHASVFGCALDRDRGGAP